MESAMCIHEVITQDFLNSIHHSTDSNVKPLSETVDDIITAK